MELFRLLGTIALDNSGANKGIDETTDKAEKSQGKISAAFEKIGSFATKAGAVVASGLAVGATAIAAITKQSLDSYAEYEQLVGGIETLFGTMGATDVYEYAAITGKQVTDELHQQFETLIWAGELAKDNAAKAFQTAGLSANEYMATITSLAAALKQSTADEYEAAEAADRAIIDMADNANKMGTSMESIQNAYQGFAKANYTMLDNLKLGYGGTKEEMERLLKDAEAISGIEYDISSFADIVNAIHVVQEEMGIAGTTAKEASSTIQGSVLATKAAWKNLLTGLADENQDLGLLIDDLATSATTTLENIVPRIQQILLGISGALPQLMAVISTQLPGLIESLLPGVISGAISLMTGLVVMLPQILQILIAQVPSIITQIGQALVTAFPVLLQTVKDLFGQIWDYISLNLLNTGVSFEDAFVKIQGVFEGAWAMCQEIWNSIGQPIFDLVQSCLGTVHGAFAERMPAIKGFVSSCFSDIKAFWENNLKPCFEAIGNFIQTYLAPVFQAIFEGTIGPLIDTTFKFIKDLWEGTLKPVFTGITDFLTGVFTGNWTQAWEGVKNILTGILNGILSGIEFMINGAIGMVNGLISGLNKLIETAGELLGLDWSIPSIPNVSLPRLEKGGILEKGQVGLLEGNGAEAVVPLDKNQAWITAVAKDMKTAIGGDAGQQIMELRFAFDEFVRDLPDILVEALATMRFDINKREFGRMVKAVN